MPNLGIARLILN